MPLTDTSNPPKFSDVYRLFELSPKEARLRHSTARDHLTTCERALRYAIANAYLDQQRVIQAGKDLDTAKRKETETRFVLVLLEDMLFRRELVNIDMHWRRFRMSHTGATNDRFVDAVMGAPDEQTTELRSSWKTICDLIASKATATPVSALIL